MTRDDFGLRVVADGRKRLRSERERRPRRIGPNSCKVGSLLAARQNKSGPCVSDPKCGVFQFDLIGVATVGSIELFPGDVILGAL